MVYCDSEPTRTMREGWTCRVELANMRNAPAIPQLLFIMRAYFRNVIFLNVVNLQNRWFNFMISRNAFDPTELINSDISYYCVSLVAFNSITPILRLLGIFRVLTRHYGFHIHESVWQLHTIFYHRYHWIADDYCESYCECFTALMHQAVRGLANLLTMHRKKSLIVSPKQLLSMVCLVFCYMRLKTFQPTWSWDTTMVGSICRGERWKVKLLLNLHTELAFQM